MSAGTTATIDAPLAMPAVSRRPQRTGAALAVAVLVLLSIHLLPLPAPFERAGVSVALSAEGKTSLAILACAVTLWVTEALPFAVTSLVAMLLIPAFGLLDFRATVRAGFGDPIIAFFIGVLILSSAFTRSGLGTRLVYEILRRVGTRVDRVLLGLLVVGSFISWWITDMAVAAMLLPLGVGLLRDADLRPRESNVGRAIMIATAFGPLIGGIATPAGTAANLVAIAQLKQLANVDVSFVRWMTYGVPAAVLMVPAGWRVLLWLFPPEIDQLPISRQEIERRLEAIGPLRGGELKTLLVFGAVIFLWLFTPWIADWTDGRFTPPVEAVALAGGLALFLPGMRVMSWKEAEHDIEWGGLMLIVAGLSLGLVVYESGAAKWLAWVLLGGISGVPVMLQAFVIVLAVAALHLMFSSNTVAASIIVPILVALATQLQLPPWAIVAPAAFTSSLAFILVSEGPTTIIPYSSGYFSIKDMAKAGVLMTVAAAGCVAISVAVNQLLGN